jgi:hypothetical protein
MALAYGEVEATKDFDAVPLRSKLSFDEMKPFILQVANELDLPKDWINSYFQSFTYVLPTDYLTRLRPIFKGKRLRCVALGAEDLLVMKIMAARLKDDRHIRRLMKREDIDLTIVEKRLEELAKEGISGASLAVDRFDEFKSDLAIL